AIPADALVLPADEAGLHCGLYPVRAASFNRECSRPTRPGFIAGTTCVPTTPSTRRVLPADEAGLHCGISFGRQPGLHLRHVLPADEDQSSHAYTHPGSASSGRESRTSTIPIPLCPGGFSADDPPAIRALPVVLSS